MRTRWLVAIGAAVGIAAVAVLVIRGRATTTQTVVPADPAPSAAEPSIDPPSDPEPSVESPGDLESSIEPPSEIPPIPRLPLADQPVAIPPTDDEVAAAKAKAKAADRRTKLTREQAIEQARLANELGQTAMPATSLDLDDLTAGFGSARVPAASLGKITVTPAGARADGFLDPAIIRRFIKRNLPKIQYCYERQLLAHSDLAGTVTVLFVVTPNGSVGSSTASGVDGEVSRCISGVISEIAFPKPKGTGGVQVGTGVTFERG